MRRSFDVMQKAADLRSRGISAARAGRFEEARAAFLESLEYDPHNVSVFLWLAGIAPSKREAYQFLDQARRLDPDHPQLTRAAEGIHRHFAKHRQKPSPVEMQAAPVYPRPSSEESGGARRVRTTSHIADGLLGGAADVLLRLALRLLSIPVLLVALVFLVALAVDLGQEGNLQALPSAVPSAAGFTADYLKGLARGDLGVIASRQRTVAGTPVAADLGRALPKSLGLLAVALTLAALVGLFLGIGAAFRRASHFSELLLFASVLGISTPSFFAAMLLIWFGVWLYQSTSRHLLPISGFGWDLHLILPALVLAARPAAVVTRLSYNALVEILESDYIRTAIAKGLKPRLVLLRHVLRNAGVPLLTTVGVSLRFSLAVLPIVEYIFNWPGVGLRLLKAIEAQDTTAVVGMTLPLILLFVLVNLLLEVLYPLVDPRLRASEVGAV
jgi:ABC-type dipeptide/oligopeptide/nickel transport system permease component